MVQEGGKVKETVSVATFMLHKATALSERLEQSMFFVANEMDACLAIDRDLYSLRIALLRQDVDGVQLSVRKLCEGTSPEALWQAASILRGIVLHFVRTGLCMHAGNICSCTSWVVVAWPSFSVQGGVYVVRRG